MIVFIAFLALIGAGLSSLALYEHIAISSGLQSASSFCKVSEQIDCQPVLASHWSQLFGISLGSYGLVFYLSLLLFCLFASHEQLLPRKISSRVVFFFGAAAFVISIILFCISKIFIGVLCPICLGTYAVNALIFVASWSLDRSVPWYVKLVQGFTDLFQIPVLIFGLGKHSKSSAATLSRFFVIVFLLVIFLVKILPDFLISRYLVEEAQKRQAIAQWMQEKSVPLPIHQGGGLEVDYLRGPASAPIQLVEFSDFQCPACRATYVMLEEVLADYRGKVSLIYKNYPLDKHCNPSIDRDFHRNACFAASFARCAGEQGKFWEVADYLFRLEAFETEKDPDQINQVILSGAESLGLDAQGMKECISSGRQTQKLVQDIKEGDALGVEGTPSIWINGKRFVAIGEPMLRGLFEQILASKK